ncbi:hypothetical protein HGRIS_012684 [Hohenbuehelia grisea]|uniref:Uncharacterized protein n=1 Tax=Hohenbuehelia grisea TaxID=104357 RepID=A0ABR3IT88_9AGAR
MTEYTISSQVYREYMSARDRTANWVQSHSPTKTTFYSPSLARSISDDDEVILPSSPPSDAGSSHSLPPQMVLRFPDGRPDVPIPVGDHHPGSPSRRDWAASSRFDRSHTLPRSAQPQSHSGPHGFAGPLSHSIRERAIDGTSPSGPEEIRVLPSRGHNGPPPSALHPSANHSRSQSLPRHAHSLSPTKPPHHPHEHPLSLPPPMHTPPLQPHLIPILPGPGVSFDQPAPAWHPYTGKGPHAPRRPPKHQPPAIVYAPGHNSRTPRYAPPAIYSYPPPKGPNGMKYSHSAPVPHSHYPNAGGTPYPSAISSSHLSSVHEERSRRSRSRGRDRSHSRTLHSEHGQRSRPSSVGSFDSVGSGSTYYVLPNARQKVHIIVSMLCMLLQSNKCIKVTTTQFRRQSHRFTPQRRPRNRPRRPENRFSSAFSA